MPKSRTPRQTRCVMDQLESRILLSRVVGYFPEYRWSTFNNIDWTAVTHINYFSVGANTSGGLTTGNINFSHMATLVSTAHNNNVTVSITVGPQSFSTIAQNATARQTFVNNIVNFALTYNLDGIDMDWEPTPTGSNIGHYGTLIDALHAQTAPNNLLLTAAVNPLNHEIPLAATAKMDWINVMGYDFSPNNHSTYNASINALNGWNNYGVPKDKLVLGVPFYGRQGTNWSNTTARTYGAIMNDHFVANGVYPSPDLDFVDGWYFNGQTTIANKSNYVANNGFGGIMIWEIGQDHFIGGQHTPISLLPVIRDIILDVDIEPPVVESASFNFMVAPHQISFVFSEPIQPLSANHLVVRNAADQSQVLVNSVGYDAATRTATFTLNNVVPDGTYTATLNGSAVKDAAGNPLGVDYIHEFFFLNGDANRDGVVNLADFNILAQNFGKSGMTFADGDFNYDGTVNLADFNILASAFGASVTVPQSLLGGPASGGNSTPFSTTRISDDVRSADRADEERGLLV